MEPERKIEKWLRAYAKKRRGQAKGAFDLHPATRRLLQDEIARQSPAPEEDDDSLSLWRVVRRQWALLLTFAACVFLIGISLPALNTAREKARPAVGMANLKQTNRAMPGAVAVNSPSAPPPEIAPQPAAPMPTTSPASEPPPPPPSAVAAAPEPNSMSEPQPGAAPAPEASTISAAPAESPQATTASSHLAVNSANVPLAMTPPPAGGGGNATRNKLQSPAMQTAARPQTGPGPLNAFQNSIIPSQAVRVLSNFQVQQNGNALRIVDQDGSVYVGSWRLASQAANNGMKQQGLQSSYKQSVGKTPQTSAPPAVVLADNLQAAQNYFFRVHGMNRTLKQRVVFTGNLLANYALSGNVQQSFGQAVAGAMSEDQVKLALTNQAAQLPWASLRITGTAVINRTNRIEVNAAPVTTTK